MLEPDDLTQHCFRCKGLVVIHKETLQELPRLLYKAASKLQWAKDSAEGIGDWEEWQSLITDLRATAILLEMVPDD